MEKIINLSRMKVLWFTNTPANADEYYNIELKGSSGWLKTMDQTLQKHVELHIAYYAEDDKLFKYKDTFYHPIKKNQSLIIKFLNRKLNNAFDKKYLNKYLEIIELVKPDIINIYGTENDFACIIKHTNIPIFVTIQGILTVILHKYCTGIEDKYLHVNNRKLTSLKDFLFPKKFSLEYQFYKRMQRREEDNLKLTKNIIGRTLWDKRTTRILAPESNYYHVDEILRDSFYQNKWIPHFSNLIIIHTTNANNFYKGFETLCLALNELNRIGINCEWRVAGILPNDSIVKIVKKKLKEKFPSKGLHLVGALNEESLVESLLRADVYVMTSHIENSPNNLCEAMILGMPCVSTFVGGVGSMLKDGVEGILIQDGDPWAITGAIVELTNNKDMAIKFGENARKIALLRHDKNRIMNSLLKAYRSKIKEGFED